MNTNKSFFTPLLYLSSKLNFIQEKVEEWFLFFGRFCDVPTEAESNILRLTGDPGELLGHVCDNQGKVLFNVLRLVTNKINKIHSLNSLRADDRGVKISRLEEMEEKWCSLYLCSRLLGLIILTLCKCRAASEKIKFTPFPKIPSFLSKITEFSDQKITPNQQLHQYFPVDFFFIFKWLLSLKKTHPLNGYVCCSRFTQFLGSVELLLWLYLDPSRVWPRIWAWITIQNGWNGGQSV